MTCLACFGPESTCVCQKALQKARRYERTTKSVEIVPVTKGDTPDDLFDEAIASVKNLTERKLFSTRFVIGE